MNQHRWTCLTTLVLTTVIAPITTVNSKTLPSPAIKSGANYSPLSPQSLPTITPLVVTELETEAAIPVVFKPVPLVSKLPIVTRLAAKTQTPAQPKPRKNPTVVKLPAVTSSFNPNAQIAIPILAVPNPIDSAPAPVAAVAPLPAQMPAQIVKPQAFTSFITKTASAPIPVVRTDRSTDRGEPLPTTVINNSATVQAEMASSPTVDRHLPGVASSDRTAMTPAPQMSPIAGNAKDVYAEGLRQRTDIPSFEAGLPVFVFDNERPAQIVATAIAQVGETIVAPEPSIAIPVERPKQSTVPSQLPGSTVPAVRSVPTVPIVPTAPTVPTVKVLPTVPTTPTVKVLPTAPTIPTDPTVKVVPNGVIVPTVKAVPTVPAIPSLQQPQKTGIVKIEQPSETTRPALEKIVATQTGQASWYGSEGGPRTANGERYNPYGLTAAHRTLPFGTKVRVTSLKTGKTVIVRINDRGPFHSRRIIDVSAGAAKAIGIKNDGIGQVRMDILGSQKSAAPDEGE